MQDMLRNSQILGFKPYMTEEYTSDLTRAFQRFRSTFIPAAIFGTFRGIAASLTLADKIPFSPYTIAGHSFLTGVEHAAFPLVNSLLLHRFSPDLRTRSAWFVWTAGASCVTAIAYVTIEVPLVNAAWTGNFSYKDLGSDVAASQVVTMATFTTAMHGLDRMLPPPERMGGRLSRSAAVVALADLARNLARAPSVVPHGVDFLSGTLRLCLKLTPMTLLDFAMYSGVDAAYRRLSGAK
jgi:hypothetical protein